MLYQRTSVVLAFLCFVAVQSNLVHHAAGETPYYFSGTGQWQANQPFVTGDVNGNGRTDVVGFSEGGVRVGLGNDWHEWKSAAWTGGFWVENYGANYGWSTSSHIRATGDVNGDGRADIVGFGQDGVYVSISRPSQRKFDPPQRWLADFAFAQGYRVSQHPRFVADVDGDGKADLVAFAGDGVRVALSTGTGFSTPKIWVSNYGSQFGWTPDRHVRAMGDINGDGRADVVGFGQDGVWISMAAERHFSAPQRKLTNLSYDAGNYRSIHPRMVADINGDGKADLIGIKPGSNDSLMKVAVALSQGSSFAAPTTETWSLYIGAKQKDGEAPRFAGGFSARHFVACNLDDAPGDKLIFFDDEFMRRFGEETETGKLPPWPW